MTKIKQNITEVHTIPYDSNKNAPVISEDLNEHEKDKDDYLVKIIGAFGLWQAVTCALAASTRFIANWNMLSIMFLTPDIDFICVNFKTNATISAEISKCYENCTEYQYYESVFETTLVADFGLICENSWLSSFIQTVTMFGVLVGVSLFGWISDRFGRRSALLTATVISVILMIIVSFSPNYWIFIALRFFIGMASGGTLIISVVIILEVVGPEYREMAGAIALMPDGFAEASLAAFAYFSPSWNIYLLAQGVASILILVCAVILPESPRWLISTGKVETSKELLRLAAQRNNLNSTNIDIVIASEIIRLSNGNTPKYTYIDLFKTRDIARKTISIVIIWFIAGICIFGINQFVTFLGFNIYITVILLGLIQVPTTCLSMVINKKFKRRPTIIGSFLTLALTMILLIFMAEGHWISSVLGIFGLGVTSIILGVVYIYMTEIFPTPLRNMAYGIGSAGAKVGAMVAPFIATIVPVWIPSLIFAVLAILVSVFCILLPETKGLKLEDKL